MDSSQEQLQSQSINTRNKVAAYLTEHGYEYESIGENSLQIRQADEDDPDGDNPTVFTLLTFTAPAVVCQFWPNKEISTGLLGRLAVTRELNRINAANPTISVSVSLGTNIVFQKAAVCYPKDEGKFCERIMKDLLGVYLAERDNLRRAAANNVFTWLDNAGEIETERFVEVCKESEYTYDSQKVEGKGTVTTCTFITPNSTEVYLHAILPQHSYEIASVGTSIVGIPESMIEPAKSLGNAIMKKYPHTRAVVVDGSLLVKIDFRLVPNNTLDYLLEASDIILEFLMNDFEQTRQKLIK